MYVVQQGPRRWRICRRDHQRVSVNQVTKPLRIRRSPFKDECQDTLAPRSRGVVDPRLSPTACAALECAGNPACFAQTGALWRLVVAPRLPSLRAKRVVCSRGTRAANASRTVMAT